MDCENSGKSLCQAIPGNVRYLVVADYFDDVVITCMRAVKDLCRCRGLVVATVVLGAASGYDVAASLDGEADETIQNPSRTSCIMGQAYHVAQSRRPLRYCLKVPYLPYRAQEDAH